MKLLKKIKNINTIQQMKQSGIILKAMNNNINTLEKFIPKINILANNLTEYIEKYKKENDEELIEILEKMIEIQELIFSINTDKIIETKKVK